MPFRNAEFFAILFHNCFVDTLGPQFRNLFFFNKCLPVIIVENNFYSYKKTSIVVYIEDMSTLFIVRFLEFTVILECRGSI